MWRMSAVTATILGAHNCSSCVKEAFCNFLALAGVCASRGREPCASCASFRCVTGALRGAGVSECTRHVVRKTTCALAHTWSHGVMRVALSRSHRLWVAAVAGRTSEDSALVCVRGVVPYEVGLMPRHHGLVTT